MLNIKGEEVFERSHKLVDIVVSVASASVALPINEDTMEPVKALWQIPPSLSFPKK